MKFLATADCLDVKTKISKVVRKTLLDLRCWTSLVDSGHIRLTWPMFDVILFSTGWRDGILPSRDEVLRGSFICWYPHINYQARKKKLLDQKSCTFFQDDRFTWLLFHIILFSTLKRDGILISRDNVKTKTSKVLGNTFPDLRCWTSFQDGGYISGAPVARRAANWNTITIGTEPHVCIEIETHATLFSWSTPLAAWITGVGAQRRRRRRATWRPYRTW